MGCESKIVVEEPTGDWRNADPAGRAVAKEKYCIVPARRKGLQAHALQLLKLY